MTDALTLSLSRISLQAMMAGRSVLCAPWGFRVPIARDGRPLMPAVPGSPIMPRLQAPGGCLYAVLSGDCVFESDFGSERLSTGDLLFMTISATHQLRDCETSVAVPIWELAPPPPFHVPHPAARPQGPAGLRVTGNGPETQFIQAILFFADGVGVPRAGIPPLLTIKAGAFDRPHWVPDLLNALAAASESDVAGSASVATRMVQALFDLAVMLDRTKHTENSERMIDARLEGPLLAMEMHADKKWQVGELAALAGMSRTAFASLFTAQLSMAPLQFLAKRRMERACRMLRAGDASIKSIALAAGYASEPAFYAAFRASEGMTPSAYRARQRNGPSGMRAPWDATQP